MIDVSVIVPVYNVEEYLDQCLDSIRNQSLENIEIILVDDGSTDKSGLMCDEISRVDVRVKVIHKDNGGLMSAWKEGVKASKGNYIGFVDSDDWIDSDMFCTLNNRATSQDLDVVFSMLIREYRNGTQEFERCFIKAGIYDRNEIKKTIYPHLFYAKDFSSRGVPVNRVTKLFRRELLEHIICDLPDEVSIGEDLLTTFCALQNANRIELLADYHPYHYRMNDSSMIRKFSDKKYDCIKLLHQELLKRNCEEYDFSEDINTDYIKLVLGLMDDEILFSGKSYFELRRCIRERFSKEEFKKIVKQSHVNRLNIKCRLYLYIIDRRWWDLLILIRRIKRV